MFRCRKVRRVRDERGSREWARVNGMRWDSWDALTLASKNWVRMKESGPVDDDPGESGFDGGVLRGCSPSDVKIM